MLIDDVNISTLGAVVQSRGPSRSTSRWKGQVKGAPEAFRRLYLGRNAPDPLILTCSGFIEGTDLSDLQDKMNEFKWLAGPDRDLRVRWSDMSGIEWVGRLNQLQFTDYDPDAWERTQIQFAISIARNDPRGRDTSDTNVTDSGSPTSDPATTGLVNEINVGSAPHPVTISITGNNGSPLTGTITVHYYDSANAATGLSFAIAPSITWDGTAISGINTETFVCEYSENGGSSWSNGGGDFTGDYFDINPNPEIHGDTSWPLGTADLRLTETGSGTCDEFKCTYRKRYF
jgi:hypothetical protein